MYHQPKCLTEGNKLEGEGCRFEDNIIRDVKEIVTNCRMDQFVLEHGPVAGCCEVGNDRGIV